jgi:transformation/transcription domain-associated protein
MSFLAYVLRTATEDIRKHAETMAEASIRLLRDCPPEAVASRKVRLLSLHGPTCPQYPVS